MGWLKVTEPYARPARRNASGASSVVAVVDDLDLLRGRAYLEHRLLLDGPSLLADVDELLLDAVEVRSTSLGARAPHPTSATGCRFDGCDLSGERFADVRQTVFTGCKLLGTDFSDSTVTDVVFERCAIRMANLRMATFERVEFSDCELVEIDGFEMRASDVTFDGSRLERMNVDRMQACRIDLRGATSCSFEAASRFDGWLVSEAQLPTLVYELAAACGLSVEATDLDGDDR